MGSTTHSGDTRADVTQANVTQAHVIVRFYAGAAEAAGAEQLSVTLSGESEPLQHLLDRLPALTAAAPASGNSAPDLTADLTRVCSRSSFLINGTRATPESAQLSPGDHLDVLPPFAGG